MRITYLLLSLVLVGSPAVADDGAASIAAGGLILMKREPRIAMAKEVLRIGPRKVVVDYDFRNNSDEDIDTVVAFPIAPYSSDEYFWSHEEAFNQRDEPRSVSRIASFRLRVNGNTQPYKTEVKALFNGHDYAPLLRGMRIDPATFGHIPEEDAKSDFDFLSSQQRARLVQLGLMSRDNQVPKWKVEVRYYWTQRFPAHKTVHIRHEYIPIAGEVQVPPDLLPGRSVDENERETAASIRQTLGRTCVSSSAIQHIYQTLEARPSPDTTHMNIEASTREWFNHLLVVDWVDFILTTANTWKQPIEDFTLIVDTKPYPNERSVPVHFCGDGPLASAKGLQTTFHARDFVPAKELTIGFYSY
jgi:hypothetical protein